LTESVFYRKRVTGLALRYSYISLIDEEAMRKLKQWFVENGYDADELEHRSIEVTYRVLPKYGDEESMK
jgi:hypothetical protein